MARLSLARALATLSVAIAPSLGCTLSGMPCPPWDDKYQKVLEEVDDDASRLAPTERWNPLALLSSGWATDAGRVAVRQEVEASARAGREAARLEWASPDGYRCIWVVSTIGGAEAHGWGRSGLVAKALSRGEWRRFRGAIQEVSPWGLKSHADFGVGDGAAYYVSLCIGGKTVQFGLYGVPAGLWRHHEAQHPDSIPTVGPQRRVVELISELLPLGRE